MELVAPAIAFFCSICSPIATTTSHVVNVDQRVRSLTAALEELKDKKDDLKGRVEVAELGGLKRTSQVKGWLERARVIEIEASLIIAELGQRRRCYGCCTANCYSLYKSSKKVSKMLMEVSGLMEKGDFYEDIVAKKSLPVPVEEMPSRPTVGLSVMLEKVEQFLEDDEVGIIGIYGMGGVGKTTLLKNINNEFLTKTHHYDVVIWVLVSKDFVADKMQQTVGARLGLNWEETGSQEQKASKIYQVMRRKKYLLLLDDVWKGFDLEEIGIPLPCKENKCKVIFTTRSLDVCSDMDAHRKLKVEFLGEEESWKLFREKVGEREIINSPSIRTHAQTIVRKCGGLPLALITIGRAMANKQTEQEWRAAVEVLHNSPSKLRGMEDVFTLLKFSYDNLENYILKACFLYCSLFPEDYSIEIEQLVEYWIGEEFLESSHDGIARDEGHAVIGSLKVACLLENGEEKTQVKMHDVVRSFALWIASEYGLNKQNFLVEPSMGLIEAPRVEHWKEAQVVSLLDNEITVLSEIPMCNKISTLLLQWNSGLNRIQNGFFQFMSTLKVLDLSSTSLRAIPVSISKLVELRHLDLSGTKLVTLPKELGFLAKLRHLDLQRTHSLRMIPSDAISGLSELRVLNLYYSYGGWEVQNYEGESEVQFKDLQCLTHLTTLGITITNSATLKRLSVFSSLLNSIQYLYIKECDGLSHLPLSSTSSGGERLRRLSINNCYDLKYLAIGAGAGENWLPSLEVLALHGLPNLNTVWRNPVTRNCLQNLRSVNIWYCHKLKNVSWLLHLPRLEVIYLFYCKEMEELISGDEIVEVNSAAFLSLRTISIRDLPELRSICRSELSFPSLERIAVIDCPKLKKLPIKAHNTSTLPTVYGNKEWWDGLVWNESSTGSAFLPHFMSI